MDPRTMGAMGGGLAGWGLGSMMGGWTNPADAASGTIDNIPGAMLPYYQPWINAGQQALPQLQQQYGQLLSGLPGLQQQYGQLMNDPSAVYNKIGAGYQQSPGFQFAMKQALSGANNASAAGGTAGSPMAQQQNMQVATGLANQDFGNYMQRAMGLYGTGLQGEQGLYNQGLQGLGGLAQMGYGAGNEFAQSMANSMLSKAGLQYAGQAAQNQHDQGQWGALMGGLGDLAGFAAFSSIDLKEKIDTPSTKEILDNVRELSLDRWKYKNIDQKFLGTYAEEFADRFGVGDGKTINMIDAIGVLMGAVKELDKRIEKLQKLQGM